MRISIFRHWRFSLSIGLFALFALLALFVVANNHDGATDFDLCVQAVIQRIRTPFLTEVMKIVTNLGSVPVLGAFIGLALFVFLRRKEMHEAIWTGSLAAFAFIAEQAMKLMVHRPRPAGWLGLTPLERYSFPSGHATMTLVVGLIVYSALYRIRSGPTLGLARRRQSMIVALVIGMLVFLIGVSRIYLSVHWPSDVVAGWLLGGGIAVCAGCFKNRKGQHG
ncbi:MAG: phosphatase PAP2 family protein [Bacteroidota bacterium]